jgi:hypothetical protein
VTAIDYYIFNSCLCFILLGWRAKRLVKVAVLVLYGTMLNLSPVRERMQTALILEYQKSVDLHTLSHLHTWLARYR